MNRPTLGEQQCQHFEDGCLLGRFDGNPTEQNCQECMDYKGPTRGAGDYVAKFIQLGKFDTIPKKIKLPEGDCKCGKRRAALNKRFPRKKD